jgi:hypothetical protein
VRFWKEDGSVLILGRVGVSGRVDFPSGAYFGVCVRDGGRREVGAGLGAEVEVEGGKASRVGCSWRGAAPGLKSRD